jgi:hypothetical protein
MSAADTPDLPMTPPGNAGADGAKPMSKSATIWLLAAAALVQLAQGVAASFGHDWAVEPLAQLQLFLLGIAGGARARASGPLKAG